MLLWAALGAHYPTPKSVDNVLLKQREKVRMCMARLRAEQSGDLERLKTMPVRQRRRHTKNTSKFDANGKQKCHCK